MILLYCCRLHANRRVGRYLMNRYSRGSGTIWLDNMHCNGSEEDISHCQHSGWGVHNCGHYEDVSINCNSDRYEPRKSDGLSNLFTLCFTTNRKVRLICFLNYVAEIESR